MHGVKDTLDKLRREGFVRVRVNDEFIDLSEEINLDKNTKDKIDVVIDRIVLKEGIRTRLFESIESATKMSSGKVLVNVVGGEEILFSTTYACPYCNYSIAKPEPRMFSFNAPYGACPTCKGLGVKLKIDEDLVINDELPLSNKAIKTLNDDQESIEYKRLKAVCDHYKIDMDKPFNKLTKKERNIILYGSPDILTFNITSRSGNVTKNKDYFEGVINNLERRYMETSSEWIRDWLEQYMIELPCDECHGARLSDSVLNILINKKNIYEVTCMSVKELITWFGNLTLTEEEQKISELVVKEIENRLNFLKNVGLEYLTLSRMAGTLSGGEAQRIRLATQIGSGLTGVLYILDEPSIGLHQRDNDKLLETLKKLRDLGNTLIVVEHDEDTMYAADQIIDIGPGAGVHGGNVIAQRYC